MPDGQRAKLIDGQFYNMAPPSRIYQEISYQIFRLLGNYIESNGGKCRVYPPPFAVNLDADDKDWAEPDISLICDPNKLTDRGCSGAPDLIFEIVSPSSRRMDYIIKNMVGREIKEKFPRVECRKGKKIFEVKNLNAGKMVRDINFSLYEGEIVGFAGLMGAGRTETTRAIFGVDPKDSGEFYVDGKKIEVNCPMDAIRNGVVLAPEDRKKDGLCTKLSIRQNLALPNLDLVCNKMGVINSGKEDALCEKAVKDLQIKTPNVEIDSGNLSGGNQQKVVVGKWLARDSRVVIFDEPTRGIDVGAKVEIYNLMNELKKQGIAVMFVSSEMPEVMGIADRIIVMCDGRITGEVSAREATQDEILTMATSFENKSIKETEGGSKNE